MRNNATVQSGGQQSFGAINDANPEGASAGDPSGFSTDYSTMGSAVQAAKAAGITAEMESPANKYGDMFNDPNAGDIAALGAMTPSQYQQYLNNENGFQASMESGVGGFLDQYGPTIIAAVAGLASGGVLADAALGADGAAAGAAAGDTGAAFTTGEEVAYGAAAGGSGGAVAGGTNALLTGGNVAKSALMGGATGLVGGAITSGLAQNGVNPYISNAAGKAGSGLAGNYLATNLSPNSPNMAVGNKGNTMPITTAGTGSGGDSILNTLGGIAAAGLGANSAATNSDLQSNAYTTAQLGANLTPWNVMGPGGTGAGMNVTPGGGSFNGYGSLAGTGGNFFGGSSPPGGYSSPSYYNPGNNPYSSYLPQQSGGPGAGQTLNSNMPMGGMLTPQQIAAQGGMPNSGAAGSNAIAGGYNAAPSQNTMMQPQGMSNGQGYSQYGSPYNGATGQAGATANQNGNTFGINAGALGPTLGGYNSLQNQMLGMAGQAGSGVPSYLQNAFGQAGNATSANLGGFANLSGTGVNNANNLMNSAGGNYQSAYNTSLNSQLQALNPAIQQQSNALLNSQFERGQAGTSGGALQTQALQNSFNQADLSAQNNAVSQANSIMGTTYGAANTAAGIGQNAGAYGINAGQQNLSNMFNYATAPATIANPYLANANNAGGGYTNVNNNVNQNASMSMNLMGMQAGAQANAGRNLATLSTSPQFQGSSSSAYGSLLNSLSSGGSGSVLSNLSNLFTSNNNNSSSWAGTNTSSANMGLSADGTPNSLVSNNNYTDPNSGSDLSSMWLNGTV